MVKKTFNSFEDFYPYYLLEHSKGGTKILHFIGTTFVFFFLICYLFYNDIIYLYFVPLFGYGFAWISHLLIEKNKPATFRYPLYSLRGDFLMYWHIISGKVKI
tara:strand:+ start:482 stop:790 length:309 start_codon:yes stop_codon:yes gene_type:complete